jgi:uncharacterized protein involved in exopolysaccharide biosynthesis
MTLRDDRPGPASRNEQVSLLGLFNLLLRERRLILGTVALATVVALVIALASKPKWETESRFLPTGQQVQMPTGLGALAFRMGVGGGEAQASFYADLLTSRELLWEAATTRYRFATDRILADTLDGTLLELYEIEHTGHRPNPDVIDRLSRDISTGILRQSQIVILTVRAPWSELAIQLNNRLLELMSEFDQEKRQSEARAERIFAEERMDQAREELRAAEESLERFLEENRRYELSPQLRFEAARLERELDFRQQIHMTLARSAEEARLDEVRNTPVITLIHGPEYALDTAGFSRKMVVLTGFLLGLTFGILLAVLRQYIRERRRYQGEEYEEFEMLRRELVSDFAPRRLLVRVRDARPSVAGIEPSARSGEEGRDGGEARDR